MSELEEFMRATECGEWRKSGKVPQYSYRLYCKDCRAWHAINIYSEDLIHVGMSQTDAEVRQEIWLWARMNREDLAERWL
jgi:hypothetical protein